MNPSVLQCKNCWKWGHTTFLCRLQEARYLKCNGFHKVEYHHHFAWCCKVNFKTNPSHLETKQGKPCPYSFKYINCKGDYQADSNACLFWHHFFNKEWHSKKYQDPVNLLNYEWQPLMIIKNIKIFSQNMQKNNPIVNTILETCFESDILFIQELSQSTICSILSSKSRDSEELLRVSSHPNWLLFINKSSNNHDCPRVITYVNIRFSPL